MNGAVLSLIMNGAIIVLLVATIVFALRLTRNLNAFRQSRGELEKLIAELSQQIDKANVAISGMRVAAKDAGKALQDRIDTARTMSDELQVMTQSGSKIAGRMERQITERPRPAAPAPSSARKPAPRPAAKPAPRRDDDGFGIRDREVEGDLQSGAERELYDALQKRRRKPEDER